MADADITARAREVIARLSRGRKSKTIAGYGHMLAYCSRADGWRDEHGYRLGRATLLGRRANLLARAGLVEFGPVTFVRSGMRQTHNAYRLTDLGREVARLLALEVDHG